MFFVFKDALFDATGFGAVGAFDFFAFLLERGTGDGTLFFNGGDHSLAGKLAVGKLRTMVLHGDLQAAGPMQEGDGGADFIDVLAAGAAGAFEGFLDVFDAQAKLAKLSGKFDVHTVHGEVIRQGEPSFFWDEEVFPQFPIDAPAYDSYCP